MSRQSKLTQFNTRIPEDLKETVDRHPDSNQDITARALRKEVGLNGKTELDIRIEQKERRIDNVRKEIDELEDVLADHMGDLEELKERRKQLTEPDEKRLEDIDEILDEMVETGRNMWPESNTVGRIATDHFNADRDAAFEAIKDRSEERDLNIPNEQFTEPGGVF